MHKTILEGEIICRMASPSTRVLSILWFDSMMKCILGRVGRFRLPFPYCLPTACLQWELVLVSPSYCRPLPNLPSLPNLPNLPWSPEVGDLSSRINLPVHLLLLQVRSIFLRLASSTSPIYLYCNMHNNPAVLAVKLDRFPPNMTTCRKQHTHRSNT